MISLVSLLSLQAHAANFTVNQATTLQAALDNACVTPLPGPHTITIESSGTTAELTLGPGSIEGDVAVYPSPTCTSVPDITIQPSGDPVTIRFQTQVGDDANLFTFGPLNNVAPNVTLRNLRLIGSLAGDIPGDPGRDGSLDCAQGGDRVRGVKFTGGTNTAGSLTVEDSYFQCLNADSFLQSSGRVGGAIWSEGARVTVTDSVFDSNAAFEGGAIAVDPGTTTYAPSLASLTVDGSTFVLNLAQVGGAVSVRKPNNAVEIRDAVFEGNLGFRTTGGVNLEGVGEVTVLRTVFDRQNPTLYVTDDFEVLGLQNGGSLRVDGADGLQFRNNIVCGSWAVEGGGVWANSPGDVDIEGSVFSENGAYCYGGGLHIEGGSGDELRVVNNTFAANEAGRPPPQSSLPDCAIGGGGAAGFEGMNPEFRNNVVAFQRFGGGVNGFYIPFDAAPNYQIGDELVFYNNLWFENNDNVGAGNVTGDFASIAFHPSNLFEDPQLVYLGDGEFNCRPDAFYPRRESPAVNQGGGEPTGGVPGDCVDYVDTNDPLDFEQDTPLIDDTICDIGAFGGRYGLYAKDSDNDGWSNIFDCNDDDPGVNPGEQDICDFIDNNCNGEVDELTPNTYWPDVDGDGFGDPGEPQELACGPIPGKVTNRDDCDDTNPAIYLGASEICNDTDDNCNELIDDGLTYINYYNDQDGDGYGAVGSEELLCNAPVGTLFSTQGGDCDDIDPLRNPETPETCGDGIDNNCNGEADPQDLTTVGAVTLYIDADQDGAGDDSLPVQRVCTDDSTEGFATAGGDCDDTVATTGPEILGFGELCSTTNVDDDCDGTADEADSNTDDAVIVFLDQDADGFGSDLQRAFICSGDEIPTGYVEAGGDCNDGDALVGECSECGCQATPSPVQGGLGLLVGLTGLLLRRRR